VSAVQTTTEQTQEPAAQEKKSSKKKNASKGLKVKSRGTAAVNVKNGQANKNGERIIIGVNTKKKNSTTVPDKSITDKSSNKNAKIVIKEKLHSSKADIKVIKENSIKKTRIFEKKKS